MKHNSSLGQKSGYVLALLLAGAALVCRAQAIVGGGTLIDPAQTGTHFPGKATVDDQDVMDDMHRLRMLNAARQKSMVSDAGKLLALARVLNAGVGADGSALSASQKMRMAADIERLARSVKEKMSYVAGAPSPTPSIRPPSNFWPQ